MRKLYIALAAVAPLAGCATTPATPMEARLNRYAGAQVVAMNCAAAGGYSSVATMRADADKNLAEARRLGATDADVAKATQRVNGNFAGAVFMVGDYQACNSFMSTLAWAGTSTPVVKPKVQPKKKP
ncbi:hypothetical protein ASG25_00325 [Rhizobium sp. Leaf384]|uniref:hypothetical protein n=1 Tax=unclassified Rhizobium TaxID=2613769 RepID=UPI000715F23A|nr:MULTISPECIES: hypothetical protein [unclassified Rhizobium]KQS74399.1 hypothetical protein ASG58_15520 [Rhizobium sp. Leaf383]KQS80138.1 hypothetical protein ASG25_00325 [Rhizobium sp. Leaf384]